MFRAVDGHIFPQGQERLPWDEPDNRVVHQIVAFESVFFIVTVRDHLTRPHLDRCSLHTFTCLTGMPYWRYLPPQVVILMNLLIAMMADTYTHIAQNAEAEYQVS